MSGIPGTDATDRLHTLFRRVALAAATLTFVVIVASAFMRHTQAGLACDDWPACYGTMATVSSALEAPAAHAAPTDVAPSGGVRIARLAHRLAATGVLALVVGMLIVAWTQKPAWKREGLLAAVALLVAGALAVLGLATPGARLPAVTLGNLLGGYLMLALFAANLRTGLDASSGSNARHSEPMPATNERDGERSRASRPDSRFALAALALVFAQAWLGGTIGAQYALTTCPTLGRCPSDALDAVAAASAFDPFRPLSVVAGHVVPPGGASAVHLAHRALALVVVVATLILARRLRRSDPRIARLLAVCTVAAPLLGVAAVLAMPSLPLTVLHNAASALTVATLAAAAARR